MVNGREMLHRVAKFTLWSSVGLGLVAFLHVAWDAYQFSLSGQQPVDDPLLVTVSITLLGMVAGACVGATLGVLISLAKRERT